MIYNTHNRYIGEGGRGRGGPGVHMVVPFPRALENLKSRVRYSISHTESVGIVMKKWLFLKQIIDFVIFVEM